MELRRQATDFTVTAVEGTLKTAPNCRLLRVSASLTVPISSAGGDKTVIRGGYGVFFDSSETREIDDSGDLYPFVVRARLSPNISRRSRS